MSKAEGFAAIGALVLDSLKELIDLAGSTSDKWHEIQQAFTTSYVDRQRQAHPEKSVLVSCQPSDERLVNKAVDETITVNVPFGAVTYRCYVFDKGEFWNRGDGSLINWCFAGPVGTVNRDGSFGEHVTFRGNPVPAPKPLPTVLPQPVAHGPDGLYLVNSFKGDDKSSGLAYYRNMRFGGNDGQQPDDYVDLEHGSLIHWEGYHKGTFNNGTVFETWINPDAEQHPDATLVGGSTNGFRNMEVFRDRSRVLYEVDGWKVHTEFWCY